MKSGGPFVGAKSRLTPQEVDEVEDILINWFAANSNSIDIEIRWINKEKRGTDRNTAKAQLVERIATHIGHKYSSRSPRECTILANVWVDRHWDVATR